MLVHYANLNIETIITTNQKDCKNYFKPCGIWFAEDGLWKKYITIQFGKNKLKSVHKYKIEVLYTDIDTINKNRVLLIDNNNKFNKLLIQYGYVSNDPSMLAIDWAKVANNFGGIYFGNIYKYRVMSKTAKHFDYIMHKNFVVFEDILVKGEFKYIPISRQVFSYTLHIDSGCIWSKKPVVCFDKIM